MALRALKTASPAAKGCDNAFAIELAFNALPALDGFSDCCVDVCCPESAGVPNVGE